MSRRIVPGGDGGGRIGADGKGISRLAVLAAAGWLAGVALPGRAAGAGLPASRTAADTALRGQVVRGPDSVAASGIHVEFHQIRSDGGQVLDSTVTGPDGRFRFAFPSDSQGVVYIASARHEGVLYFGPPLHGSTPAATPYRIAVFDTAHVRAGESLPVEIRHLVLQRAGDRWEVTDVSQLSNDGGKTLVSGGEDAPLWTLALPTEAREVQLLPDGLNGSDVQLAGHAVRVVSNVLPGGERVGLRYFVASDGAIDLTVGEPIRRFELLVEGEGARIVAPALQVVPPTRFQGSVFQRAFADDLAPGQQLRIRVQPPAHDRRWAWLFLAGGGVLAAAAAYLFLGSGEDTVRA